MGRTSKSTILATLVCVFAPAGLLAAPANMSGHWVLNIKESKWGKKKAPQNIVIDIQHQDPRLKYTGELTSTLEGQATTFSFDGAIDGQEYTLTEDQVQRKLKVERQNDFTIRTTATSMDGKSVETAATSLSRDGRRLTRRITLRSPEGEATWVEVYDKAAAQAK
ncbi:MAG TPA: hypothetical protein VFL57_21285 [Bryobacteraceae bacterium]|nr:hypothetical protein [Bryobacteraceae bacterium]